MKTEFLKLELPQPSDFVNVLTQISANYQVLDLYAKNQNSIKIIAGKGLVGGGTLNADITLNLVSSNEGITIEENSITLNVLNVLNSTDQKKPVSADALRIVNKKADDKLPKGTYVGTAKDLEDTIKKVVSDLTANVTLFEGSAIQNGATITLSEPLGNFRYLNILCSAGTINQGTTTLIVSTSELIGKIGVTGVGGVAGGAVLNMFNFGMELINFYVNTETQLTTYAHSSPSGDNAIFKIEGVIRIK